MSSLGCGDENNEGLKGKGEDLLEILEIPLSFLRAHLGFVQSSLGARAVGG